MPPQPEIAMGAPVSLRMSTMGTTGRWTKAGESQKRKRVAGLLAAATRESLLLGASEKMTQETRKA